MFHLKKGLILEKMEDSQTIRNIVRDIISIYKVENDGEFYLPEESQNNEEGELEYIGKHGDVSVELTLEQSKDVDDYIQNAYFAGKENVIEVKVIYNPEKKEKIIYDLIGELNELVGHEMRHLYQKAMGTYNLDDDQEDDDTPPFEYYSDPKEIDAQVHGFRRMKKITRRPFEELVRNWFKTHKNIHRLDPEEEQKIIKMILDYNSKI